MNRFITFLFLTITSHSFCQYVTVTQIATLPAVINESSGLEINNRNKIFSHNDSGGNPEIYQIDTTGALTRTLHITNATNTDWEELAQDSLGNIYIGDFGNNNNDRTDLKIYKIQNPDSITGTNNTTAQIIHFTYPDQFAFPPPDPEKNFDMEAMIACYNSLYIFSKNRTNPYNGYTKLYKLPNVAGTYTAQLLDSFYTGAGPWQLYSITAADISPDYSKLTLLTSNKIFVFTNFTGDQFFQGALQTLTINGLPTQKEGICFINNYEIYLSDELNSGIGGKLYYLNLQPVLSSTVSNSENNKPEIKPNPFSDELNVSLITSIPEGRVELYNMLGNKILSQHLTTSNHKLLPIRIGTANLTPGMYILKVFCSDAFSFAEKVIKVN